MKVHLVEGEGGCRYAVEHDCVAVIIDALRASATAAMLLDAGCAEIIVVREVDQAFALRKAYSEALLFGERGGVAPEGFDFGNSPLTVSAARGRRVIFTTTTGAGRTVQSWGARAVYVGSTVNMSALAAAAVSHGRDIVLVPAGLMGDPGFDAQEDWVAACAIAGKLGLPIGQGAGPFGYWHRRIRQEGIPALFATAPHAAKLDAAGFSADVAYCAESDLTDAVPVAVERSGPGVVLRDVRRL